MSRRGPSVRGCQKSEMTIEPSSDDRSSHLQKEKEPEESPASQPSDVEFIVKGNRITREGSAVFLEFNGPTVALSAMNACAEMLKPPP